MNIKKLACGLLATSALITGGATVILSNDFKGLPAQADDEPLVVTITKDTITKIGAYVNSDDHYYDYFAFSPLKNSGNHVALINRSGKSRQMWCQQHLFYVAIGSDDVGWLVEPNIIVNPKNPNRYYRDNQMKQEIVCPKISNLLSIEITFGEGNDFIPDATFYGGSTITVTQNSDLVYTISGGISSHETYGRNNPFPLVHAIPTKDDVGKELIIDQIKLTYNCANV